MFATQLQTALFYAHKSLYMRSNYSTIEIDIRQLVQQAEQEQKKLFKISQ